MARSSHCALSIMVKSEDGKVERARAGRENRRLAIAVEIGMAGIHGGRPGMMGATSAPYQSAHRRRALQSVPSPGEADPKNLTTRSAPHPAMVTFIVDPMNARLLEDIRLNTTSRLVVMTLRPYLDPSHYAFGSLPHDPENFC